LVGVSRLEQQSLLLELPVLMDRLNHDPPDPVLKDGFEVGVTGDQTEARTERGEQQPVGLTLVLTNRTSP
jgi:hypothetical protein